MLGVGIASYDAGRAAYGWPDVSEASAAEGDYSAELVSVVYP